MKISCNEQATGNKEIKRTEKSLIEKRHEYKRQNTFLYVKEYQRRLESKKGGNSKGLLHVIIPVSVLLTYKSLSEVFMLK